MLYIDADLHVEEVEYREGDMAGFFVTGPHVVPIYKERKSRFIDSAKLNSFWDKVGLGERIGCYIFGMRVGRGVSPWYVGKTANRFDAECFTDNKCNKYNQVLARHGTPVMYLVVLHTTPGRNNESAIGSLEKFLIQGAYARNAEIKNVQGINRERWSIDGVLRSGKGKPSSGAMSFKSMLGF